MSGIGCEYCDGSFGSEQEQIRHALDEHEDEISSHDRDKLKKRLNKLEQEEAGGGGIDPRTKKIGGGVAALLVVASALFFATAGENPVIAFDTSEESTVTGGSASFNPATAGTTHEHMEFSVIVDGKEVDFSRGRYQLQSEYVHFENGDGQTIHKHATGVTAGYALQSLGIGLTEDCLELATGERYCEPGGDLAVTVGGKELENASGYVLQEGVPFEVRYESS